MALPDEASYRITRQFAAKSQLETAILLYATEADHISAHVLSWAAADMLRGIASANGITSLQEEMDAVVRPEKLKDWRDIIRRGYNFSKHADRDPDAELPDFRPGLTAWVLFFGVVTFQRVFGSETEKMTLYRAWFSCRYPEILSEEGRSLVPRMRNAFDAKIEGSLADALSELAEKLSLLALIDRAREDDSVK